MLTDKYIRFRILHNGMREFRLRGTPQLATLSYSADSSMAHHALRDNRWPFMRPLGSRTPHEHAHFAVVRLMGAAWAGVRLNIVSVPVPRWRAEKLAYLRERHRLPG